MEEDDDDEPLSPSSAAFHTANFNVHVLAIMGSTTPANVELIKAKFSNTLLKHPRFSSVVIGDPSKGEELRWKRTEVDIDKHIIIPKINLENLESSSSSPDKFVEDYIYNLSKTTLDKSRPLWELHILQLEISKEVKSLGIFRIHHSLGDGTSLISLLLALTRKTSDPEALPTIPVQKVNNNNNNNNNRRGLFFWRWIIMAIWFVLRLFWNTLIDTSLFVATSLFLKDSSVLQSSSGGANINTRRRMVYKSFSLDDMKLVKNAIGGTINDVALGITQGGLSQYLSRKYDDGNNHEDTKEKKKGLAKNILLRSLLLINLRPSGGIQALADMMEKDSEAKWGNPVGYVLLPFIIGLRNDPLDYIREAKNTVDRKKHSLEAFFSHFMAQIVLKLFGTKVASSISDRLFSHVTIAFSNLPGPLEEISLCGHPVSLMAGSSYGQPNPVMINFQSYSDKMTLTLAVDEYAVPDPHQLCDDIVQTLKLVKEAVITQATLVNKNS
ncbi:hypothetical protein SOVF_054360 [Spinacia oleracea]|nr:hypothetical protein SOVF_054360 [Spinacia oleracea]